MHTTETSTGGCLFLCLVKEALSQAGSPGRWGLLSVPDSGSFLLPAPPSCRVASLLGLPGDPKWLLGFRSSPPCSRQLEGKEGEAFMPSSLGKVLRSAIPHFCFSLTDQNLVPWPHLSAMKLGKAGASCFASSPKIR